jgi:hypothetical protein
MAVTYWVRSGSLEAMVWVGQILEWLQQQTGGTFGAAAGPAMFGAPGSAQALMNPSDLLSIQVHPALAPFLDLAPASGAQAAMQRFIQLQVGGCACCAAVQVSAYSSHTCTCTAAISFMACWINSHLWHALMLHRGARPATPAAPVIAADLLACPGAVCCL